MAQAKKILDFSQELEHLNSKNSSKIKVVLQEFNEKHANLFNFAEFHTNGQWNSLWGMVFNILNDSKLSDLFPLCLNTVRILSRDEFSLQTYDIIADFNCLLGLAHLTLTDTDEDEGVESDGDELAKVTEEYSQDNKAGATEIAIEAMKCLCNLVFQSSDCRRQCFKVGTADSVLKRLTSSKRHPITLELYDMKLLFLITGLEPAARTRLQIDLNGITYMTELLDDKLNDEQKPDDTMDDMQLDILIEMLKVMFNITTAPDKSPNENEIQNLHLTNVIRKLLYRFGDMKTLKERNVVSHAVNLLTNISGGCLEELITKGDTEKDEGVTEAAEQKFKQQQLIFEGRNVYALDILLHYLQLVLQEQENSASSNDFISPILTVLLKCARSNATMRHYIRSVILPPLRDVSNRPEVGQELRNYLCRYLTQPATLVRSLSAELLFVCCKENVGRMIKYTGYGNAAGIFANRGVLDCRRVENTQYSSDSEDSDTEEYKQIQHEINPVVGCYEPPKKNPLEGMSDEQKEHEAMELVKLMDKLQKTGIMQPCRIGEDGKPQPVDHILQLQEELPQQQLEQKRKT